jgi:hypothetical protein
MWLFCRNQFINTLRIILFSLIFLSAANGADLRTIKEFSQYPQLGDVLVISGDFVADDIDNFDKELRYNSRIGTVAFESQGGLLNTGIEIGRRIRSAGLKTLALETCASACALAWIAGRVRYANEETKIGFQNTVARSRLAAGHRMAADRAESTLATIGSLGGKRKFVALGTNGLNEADQVLASENALMG